MSDIKVLVGYTENLNFLREVIDNALTGMAAPESLVRALEMIEEMLTEAGETNGEVSTDSDESTEVVEDTVDEAVDGDDIPF